MGFVPPVFVALRKVLRGEADTDSVAQCKFPSGGRQIAQVRRIV
jgi:hypothetical protein